MKLARMKILGPILLLSAISFAQQTPSTNNPDRTATPTEQTRTTDQTYSRPVETARNWGGWGLLGLPGLGGLLGRRGASTTGTTYTRDERTYDERQRRVG